MTQKELQDIFESEFNWDNWKKVMNFVFPEFKFNLEQTDLARDTKAKEEKAGFIKMHGQTELASHETLMLCEVLVKDTIRLDRNVKSVRNLVAGEVIPNYQTVIAVFHNADNTKWRFTLVVKEFTEGHKTYDKKPESYTYVFGVHEKGRTAAERFYKLHAKKEKTLKDLEEAFSVEALSKKFFTEYKAVYNKFVEDIKNNLSRLALFKGNEKNARDFVKKMMGRLVFLYFLQKKGWMGCQTKWKDGDEQFMKSFLSKAKQDDLFYHHYLEPLFFDTLNDKRTKQDEDCIIQNTNFGKVPYLNGGLFEKEDSHPKTLTLPWATFQEFFETLNNYNFTIIEDDPEFKEIAVDPEMLGHIFENLLEDNKDKGAFYTPKEIVHYMCQESLYEYLKTYLNQHNVWPAEEAQAKQLEKSLHDFVTQKTAGNVIDFDKLLARALKEVKICDPAIGSGAFPMGLLNEIFQCVHVLFDASPDTVGNVWEMETWQPNAVKLNIIQNSIYGVDIEKGAVDIARLRFWLSLIIDEPEPTALPNLDYKIVVGNSLVSKLGDDIIDIDWNANETSHGLFGAELAENKKKLLQRISEEQKESFNPDSDKRKLATDIRNLKIDLLINQLELMVKLVNQDEEPKSSSFTNKKKFVQATFDYHKVLGWKKHIKNLRIAKENQTKNLEFFDWKLDFPEVMNEQLVDKPGFDIVIGNPPYISYYGNTGSKLSDDERSFFVVNYHSVKKVNDRINSMNLFAEVGVNILKTGGSITLIVNKTMAVLPSYVNIREHILNNYKINYLILDLTPFEAIVDCLIFGLVKSIPLPSYNLKFYRGTLNDHQLKKNTDISNNLKLEFIFSENRKILEKLEEMKSYLGDILTINRGVNIGGCFEDFLSETKLSAEYKKYLSGTKCISKFHYEWSSSDGYMIFDLEREASLRKRGKTLVLGAQSRFLGEKVFIPESGQELMGAYCDEVLYSAYGLLVGTASNNLDLKYSCALINSKLLTFYAIEKEILRKGNKATPHVGVKGLKQLPIPNNNRLKVLLANLVDQIIQAKRTKASTFELELKCDALIYKAYMLDFDDVITVDPNFSLPEVEYNALKID